MFLDNLTNHSTILDSFDRRYVHKERKMYQKFGIFVFSIFSCNITNDLTDSHSDLRVNTISS